jgi:hypothetical protein
MSHNWLAEVLDDMVDYAKQNDLNGLIPYLTDAKAAVDLCKEPVDIARFLTAEQWGIKQPRAANGEGANGCKVLQFRTRS